MWETLSHACTSLAFPCVVWASRASVAAAFVASAGVATPALAQAETNAAAQSPYRVRWDWDLSIAAAAGLAWGLPHLFADEMVDPSCPCSSSRVNGFDRLAVGHDSATARTTSDILVGSLAALPFALDALDAWRSGGDFHAFAADAVVMGQAILVSGAINQMVKLAIRRPRPLTYDQPADTPGLRTPDNYLSFYSAHTSTAFAATMAYATTFALRHPDSAWRPFIYGAAGVTGGTVALLRVLGGNHFPTDVLAGAMTGAAIGLTLPRLHRRRDAALVVAPISGGAVAVFVAAFN